MNRCLNERALFDVTAGEGTAAQHAHLRMCADCAERYDEFTEDLQAIGDVLVHAPPAARAVTTGPRGLVPWVPIAAAATVLLALGSTLLLAPTPVQVGTHAGSVPAFAADVSAALFASGDDASATQIGSDAPYLQAAFEGGLTCTQERFVDGECDDQVVALLLESD